LSQVKGTFSCERTATGSSGRKPEANQLGVLLVCYSYFAYTFQQFPAGAAYKINGVATVGPTGF
jgi:hypothetical protein